MTPNLAFLLLYVLPAILMVTLLCMASKSLTVSDLIKYIFWGIIPIANIIILLVAGISIISETTWMQTF
jgi:chromate transport protein ChrA